MQLKTQRINLSINYRSQNSILGLANNIVKLLETIFPQSIDVMAEEANQTIGAKPYILEPMGDELLCHYLFGKSQATQLQQMANDESNNDFEVLSDGDDEEEKANLAPGDRATRDESQSAPHFGANQVVIVRD